MKKQSVRIISFIIIFAFFIGFIPETDLTALIPARAHADEIPAAFSLPESVLGAEMRDGQWQYALRKDETFAVITGYDGVETAVSVPESVGGYDVVGVVSKALSGKTQVTLPGTVYYIAEDAFGEGMPEITAPNGSYALFWASAHGFSYQTGKDYELVPGVIDYTDAPSWRIQKRGESYVTFDALTSMPLKVGSLFLMRDARRMEFFFRVVELFPEDGGMLASVEIPDVSEVFINYETTVDVTLTADDFTPADGVTVDKAPPRLRSVSSGSDTKTTPISANISGKTKGGMKWSGSAGGNFSETVNYTVTIVDGEVINTKLTKTESNEFFVKIECSASTKVLGEINKARGLAEKKAKGETITEEEYDFLESLGVIIQGGKGSISASFEDSEAFDDLLDSYFEVIESDSKIDHSSKLGEFRLQTPYFNISLRADVSFSVAGSLTYTFTNNAVTMQHYDFAADKWVIDDTYSSVFSGDTSKTLTAQIKGSISFKLELSVGAAFLSDLSVEFEVGIEATAKKVVALNGRKFNNCTECTLAPFASFNAYGGVWVGKNYGIKIQIYSNKWTAQDLLGKEYLLKAHINAALPKVFHYPEDCPLKDTFTVHYQTRCGLTVKDRDIFPGGALTSAYNPNLNEDPHVSGEEWTAGAFLGWAWGPTDTTPTAAAVGEAFHNPEDNSTPFVPSSDCTVYDVWESAAIVTFNSNGGTPVDSQRVPIGGHVLRPEDPIKEDEHLIAWKTEDGQYWNFARDIVSSDITLIADWGDGNENVGGTTAFSYIGNIEDVSADCIYDPNSYQGQSAAWYFEYEEMEVDGSDVSIIRITGLKNNPVHLVVPARLPSLSNEHATLEVFDIAEGAFSHCESLRSVYFLTDDQKQITTDYMFTGCTNLEYVELPALEYGNIGAYMFSGCSALKCVKVRAGADDINEHAFEGTALRSCILEEGFETFGYSSFGDCKALDELYIPDSFKGYLLGDEPFWGCTAVKRISVGGMMPIGFLKTGSRVLEKLTIRSSVGRVPDDALNSSADLYESNESRYRNGYSIDGNAELIIEEGVEEIGDRAFDNCKMFSSITIPKSVTSIGVDAFAYCTGVHEVNLPLAETLGDSAFFHCENLQEVTLKKVKEIGEAAFKGCANLKDVKLGAVQNIGNEAFDGCICLRALDLGNVESIGQYAFRDCSSLEELYIPDTVRCISVDSSWYGVLFHAEQYDRGPFFGCAGLKRISIGGVESLTNGMLKTGSQVLEKLTIRGSVKTIQPSALDSLSSYSNEMYVNGTGGTNGYDFDGNAELVIEEGVERICDYAFRNCKAFSSIIIPESVTFIGNNAFERCEGIHELSLPNGTLGDCAFQACTNLVNVELGQVREIGNNAFDNCISLKNLDLGTVEHIGKYAFQNCNSLEELYIPDTVKTIDEEAYYAGDGLSAYGPFVNGPFVGCTGLKRLNVGGEFALSAGILKTDSRVLEKVTIRGSLKRIGEHAFDSSNSFAGHANGYDYNGNAELVIEDGVEEIGDYAFDCCNAFRSITIPSSITRIGEHAFSGCVNLKDMIILGSNMPFADNTFSYCSPTLHILGDNPNMVQYCEAHGLPYDTDCSSSHLLTLYMSKEGDSDKTEILVNWLDYLPVPVWDDHVFCGWFLDAEYTSRWTDLIMPNYNLTLYARWQPKAIIGSYQNDGKHITLVSYHQIEEQTGVLYLPETVDGLPLTTIAAGAFSDSDIAELFIPSSVTDIETGAFAGSNLRGFHVSADNSVYRSSNSVIYSKDGSELLFFPPVARYRLTIPAGVTRIAPYAFDGSQLDSVAFNEGLLEIGERAFRNTHITEIVLPTSLETIGERAFADCGNLHYIEATTSPAMIGENAFAGCNPFLAAYGPDEDCALSTVIRNGGYHYNAYTLTLEMPLRTAKRIYDAGTELLLPTNPETAENQRFTGWFTDAGRTEPFTGTVMPAQDLTLYAGTSQVFNYETISDPETGNVLGLRITACSAPDAELIVPETIGGTPVISIAAGAFGPAFTHVTLPDDLNEIETGAFAAGTILVCAPGSSVEAVAQAAGYAVSTRRWTLSWESGFALKPESATLGIGEAITAPTIERSGYELTGWYYDEGLTEALMPEDTMPAHNLTLYAAWDVTDSNLAQLADAMKWTVDGDTITITGYTGNTQTVSIPSALHGKTVTAIAPNAFAYNNTVTELVLPDSVATLGEKVFFAMRGLQSLTLPAGLNVLPADALNGCSALETLDLPEGLETVAANAFANTGLTELCLPASLLTLDASSLRGCASLSEIQVTPGNSYFESRDGVLYDTADGILVKYPAARLDESYTVSDTWSIGSWAFENAQALREVTFNADIYTLGTGAFRNCNGLIALPVLGEYVSKIPDECFYGCASLSAETLPEPVRELGRYAFANSGLSELTVSEQLTRIGSFALGSDVLLRGESGCFAQTWAEENGLIFVPVGSTLVESISLPEARVTLNRGEQMTLSPSITPTEASNATLQYLSADENVVRVDENGRIYAVGGGITTIYISAPGGASTECLITVDVPLENFTLSLRGRIAITTGESIALGAKMYPTKATNQKINYTSSNPSVATISDDGIVTTLKYGATLITAIPLADETMAKSVLILCGLENQLRLPSMLSALDEEAMAGSNAAYVLFPETIEAVGKRAFSDCGALCLAEFPNVSVNLGDDVFLNCQNVTLLAPAGGSVERYAVDHSIPFIALESIDTD